MTDVLNKQTAAGRLKRLVSLIVFGCMWMAAGTLHAQMAKGQVVANTDGSPLIGASVVEKGTSNGTVTDVDGNFSINVSKVPATLVVSYIGYTTTEVAYGGGAQALTVRLGEGAQLQEVVITALGIERSRKNITYAVQELSGDAVRTTRDANFVNTLNGKVAGLQVTTNAGGPGGAARIVLRGNRSVSGSNNALIVVDGVPIDNSNRGQVGNDFGGYNSIDGVSSINPADIENISFLKGGAAAALYGSRGANGVMLITTKKGREGRLSVDLTSGVNMETPTLLPSLQNTYGQGNGGTSNTVSSGSWGGKTTTYPDNIADFFRTGVSLNNSIGITGGTEKTQAYFSFTNNRDQGIIPNNNLNRNTFNLRISQKMGNRLSADVKATVVQQFIENKVKVGEESGIVQNLYKIPRSVNLADYEQFEDANGNPTYWTTSSIYMNPYWTLNRVPNDDSRDRVTFLGTLTYDLTNRIKLTGRASLDKSNDLLSFKFYNNTLLFAGPGGTYQEGSGYFEENNFDLFLNGYENLGENLRLDFLLGTALNQREGKYTFVNANGLLVPNKFSTDFGRNVSTSSSLSQREQQSVFGTVSLAYKSFLIFDASARNDWSSTLPAPHAFFYPSAGASLILSDMVTLPEFFSFAKLRGTWSQVGNDADPYRLQNTFAVQQGGSNGFIALDPTKNIPDLKPELTTSIEFGADVRMLNGRLGLDVTYYKTNSINQLFLVPLPAPSGFSQEYINAGNIQNKGIEAMLNWRVKENENFGYSTTINFARNVNDVIELSDRTKTVFLGGGFGRTAGPLVEEGGRYGNLYAEGWKRDDQGRFIVDAQGLPVGSGGGQTFIGNFNPDFLLGWNNQFNIKGVSLSILVDGRFGGVMVSGTDANLAFDGTADYTEAFRDGGLTLDAVRADGTPNTVAVKAEQFWTRVSGGRYSFGEFFTYDATNVRIREMSLGYNFNFSGSKGPKSLRLSLVGRNLLFLYRGSAILDIPGMPERKMNFDPDIQLGAGNFQGVEYGNLPSTRSLGLNLQLGF
jgi:TonB-linked SusC/RagA family outer membrane protein